MMIRVSTRTNFTLFPSLSTGTFSLVSEWHQVFSALLDFLSILANHYNTVVWMVLILPLISKPLETVPSAPTMIGITITLLFHSFYSSQARFKYLSLVFCFVSHPVIHWNDKVHKTASSLYIYNALPASTNDMSLPYLGQDLCPFSVGPSLLLGLEAQPIACPTSGPHSSPCFSAL